LGCGLLRGSRKWVLEGSGLGTKPPVQGCIGSSVGPVGGSDGSNQGRQGA
jgi:hypothetical protein